MIELTLFGALRLTRDGASVGSVLTQPKRVALLAYLALAGRESFRRRDEIVALFWPEADEARARAALNTAIHYIRRALGPGTILSRGNEEVRIAPGRVTADVAAFEAALDDGHLEAALALYAGDLMPGFHLSEAAGFEHWLEEERTRLRRRALEAAGTLAERCGDGGHTGAAVSWARRAVELSRCDEGALRRLIRLLARAGDRGTALEEFERYRAWLAEEFEMEPSEATLALIAELRATSPVADDASPLRASRGGSARPTSHIRQHEAAAPADGAAQVRPPWTQRVARGRAAVVAVGLAALGMAAYGAGGAPGASDGDVPSDPARLEAAAGATPRVAVLPFAYRGDDRFAYLGAGIAELLAIKVNLPGILTAADPRAVLQASREVRHPADVADAVALAGKLDAGWVLLGSVIEAGGRLEIGASLYERERLHSTVTVRVTAEDEILDAIDELAAGLLASQVRNTDQLTRTAALTTGSLAALKAYLEAESAFRAGTFADALSGFQHAAALDSTFALAHYQVGVTADWAGRYELIEPALDRAWHRRDQLPERIRRVVEARIARRRDPARAERLLGAALGLDPYALDALTEMVDLWFHYPPLGGSPAQIRAGFERIVALDPGNQSALLHLARLSGFEGKTPELERLVGVALARGAAGELALELRALRAFALDDLSEQAAVIRELRSLGNEPLARLVSRTINYSDRFERTRPLAGLLRERSRPPRIRALGAILAGGIEMASGRSRHAVALFDSAATLDARMTLIVRGMLAAVPALPADSAEMAEVMVGLARWDEWPTTGPAEPNYITELANLARPALVAGLLAARTGDRAAALRHAADLEPDAARIVRAAMALNAGSPAEAARLARTAGNGFPFGPVGIEIAIRAAAAERLARDDEALRWHRAMTGEVPLSFAYRGISHLRRAEIQDRRGDVSVAARHYARFVELWSDADAEHQPLVSGAKERLRQLIGSS